MNKKVERLQGIISALPW